MSDVDVAAAIVAMVDDWARHAEEPLYRIGHWLGKDGPCDEDAVVKACEWMQRVIKRESEVPGDE